MEKKAAIYIFYTILFILTSASNIHSADRIPDIIQFKDATSEKTFQVPFKRLIIYDKYKEMRKLFAPKKPLRISLQKGCAPSLDTIENHRFDILYERRTFYPRVSTEPVNDQDVFNNLHQFFYFAHNVTLSAPVEPPFQTSDIPDFNLAIDYLAINFDDQPLTKQMQKCVDKYLPLFYKNESLFSWGIRQITHNPPPKKEYDWNRIIKTLVIPFRENDTINDWQPDPFFLYLIANLMKVEVPPTISVSTPFKDKEKRHQNPLLNYIKHEDEYRSYENYKHKQQQSSFWECIELQHLRTKYRNLVEDKHEIYPANLIMEEVQKIGVNHRRTCSVIGYMATCDVNENVLEKYLKKYVETVVTKVEKPIIIGTWSTVIKLPFLKALAKWSNGGKLCCNFNSMVNQSNPPQQEMCISCIIDGKPKLAVGIGFYLSEKDSQSPSLERDTRYWSNEWTFYPNEKRIQEDPSEQNTRDLVMYIQDLEPCSKTPNSANVSGRGACYWRWCSPPADA